MTPARSELVRAGVLGAALVLAVLSKGDVVVLAVLLAAIQLFGGRPLPMVAAPAALLAAAVRWQSLALEDIAGAQAVLGPAGVVAPPAGAAAAWAGAAALICASTRRTDRLWSGLTAATFGATAALVVAGAAPGGAVWARVVATVVAGGLAVGVGELRSRCGDRWFDALALFGGSAALVLAVSAASEPGQGLEVRFDLATFVEGLVIAVAAGAVAVLLAFLVAHRQQVAS